MMQDWLLALALGATIACNAESAPQPGRTAPTTDRRAGAPVSFAPAPRQYVALRLTFTPTFDQRLRMVSPDPFELQLVIIDNTEGRVRGVLSSRAAPGLPLVDVRGTVVRGQLQLSAERVKTGPGEHLSLSSMELSGKTGRGTASGTLSVFTGDVGESAPFTAIVTAAADDDAGVVSFRVPRERTGGQLLSSDPIEVVISEPVPYGTLAAVRVMAGGKPHPGELRPTAPVYGLTNAVVFVPKAFLPASATLTVAPTGLTDTAGHPVSWDGVTLTTAGDPGPLTANASFEDGLRGWQTTGDVSVTGVFEGIAPAVGVAQAIVTAGSSLAGYVEVPARATELTVSYAILSQMGEFDGNHSVVLALVAEDGTRTVIVDGVVERARGERGTFGTEYRHRIPARVARVDLRPHRGRRVTLTADVRSSSYMGLQNFALVLDDVRVR
jgi:hypothetical protein